MSELTNLLNNYEIREITLSVTVDNPLDIIQVWQQKRQEIYKAILPDNNHPELNSVELIVYLPNGHTFASYTEQDWLAEHSGKMVDPAAPLSHALGSFEVSQIRLAITTTNVYDAQELWQQRNQLLRAIVSCGKYAETSIYAPGSKHVGSFTSLKTVFQEDEICFESLDS
ncbi:MAG: hypothetical protein F6K19_14390 [Cyanothece sp. SIO1E1]|nr:hypothetical protein [Cyanothece sp. SIO1E1]